MVTLYCVDQTLVNGLGRSLRIGAQLSICVHRVTGLFTKQIPLIKEIDKVRTMPQFYLEDA